MCKCTRGTVNRFRLRTSCAGFSAVVVYTFVRNIHNRFAHRIDTRFPIVPGTYLRDIYFIYYDTWSRAGRLDLYLSAHYRIIYHCVIYQRVSMITNTMLLMSQVYSFGNARRQMSCVWWRQIKTKSSTVVYVLRNNKCLWRVTQNRVVRSNNTYFSLNTLNSIKPIIISYYLYLILDSYIISYVYEN